MIDDFYLAFEDRYRGSRELIASRLRVYLPFVLPLRRHLANANAVDLGCGRGEWLELLRDHKFDVQGTDTNRAMSSVCQDLGLSVHGDDALDFLRNLPDASQAVVSGFHIVEHIPFAALQELVSEAKRVLQPGGILILETPNPENLVVGASSFYLDPTHLRPIPPKLLKFLSEYAGFKRSRIVRLQELAELAANAAPCLIDVLRGASPDYAVIAQKEGASEVMQVLNLPFGAEYGLTLEELANRYQQKEDQLREEVATLKVELSKLRKDLSKLQDRGATQTHLSWVRKTVAGIGRSISTRRRDP